MSEENSDSQNKPSAANQLTGFALATLCAVVLIILPIVVLETLKKRGIVLWLAAVILGVVFGAPYEWLHWPLFVGLLIWGTTLTLARGENEGLNMGSRPLVVVVVLLVCAAIAFDFELYQPWVGWALITSAELACAFYIDTKVEQRPYRVLAVVALFVVAVLIAHFLQSLYQSIAILGFLQWTVGAIGVAAVLIVGLVPKTPSGKSLGMALRALAMAVIGYLAGSYNVSSPWLSLTLLSLAYVIVWIAVGGLASAKWQAVSFLVTTTLILSLSMYFQPQWRAWTFGLLLICVPLSGAFRPPEKPGEWIHKATRATILVGSYAGTIVFWYHLTSLFWLSVLTVALGTLTFILTDWTTSTSSSIGVTRVNLRCFICYLCGAVLWIVNREFFVLQFMMWAVVACVLLLTNTHEQSILRFSNPSLSIWWLLFVASFLQNTVASRVVALAIQGTQWQYLMLATISATFSGTMIATIVVAAYQLFHGLQRDIFEYQQRQRTERDRTLERNVNG